MMAAKKDNNERMSSKQANKQERKKSLLTSRVKPSAELLLKKAPEVKTTAEEFPIIGMGASAGGLEAFERFFKNMPPD